CGSALSAVLFILVNIITTPHSIWAIYPVYALIWWPLSIAFAKRKYLMVYSLCGSILSAALFIFMNIITTPHNIWAIYPIFAFVWWPLATYYFIYKRRKNLLEQ
ncbi:MAG: hypothetical protein P4M02_09755, partial [Clostridia bacterium]|nr:hypothetical protein [Clostridia bacterium]